ncbi:MAG: lysine--tRNA ligase [Myxococcota bacterium]|nr:lysine--tRNA ligase [Myxococcota bacterium]
MADEPKTSNSPGPQREAPSAEQSIIDARRAKAARVRARGENPFANDVRSLGPVDDIAEVRASVGAMGDTEKYDAAQVAESTGGRVVHVCGRVVALRSTGALSFVRLRDRTGEIQLMLDQSVLKGDYDRVADLDVGDFVEAKGGLTASKRGELSVLPSEVRLVTKAYRPLPEKWHGLTDVEIRYRQRYIDLVANPDVADVFRARSQIVRATRQILDSHNFLEVETPVLHPLIGGAAARPFATHHNALDMPLYLRIAPELYLKRLIVAGLERVYEIGRSFRNEGVSARHNPEFTMLEFYWAYATYDDLMEFTEKLIRGIDAQLADAMPAAHAQWKNARPFTLDEPFVRLPMNDAVAVAAGRTAIPQWVASVADRGSAGLAELLQADFGKGIKEWAKSSARAKALDWGNFRNAIHKCSTPGERLFACYEYVVEPFLADDYRSADGRHSVPVLVKDYPFEVSPLARRNDARPELTDRFELFVHGRELCNAFSELNDPDDQAARFRAQVEKKTRGDEETMDYDEDYIRALEHGMPPAAGFGMGIDRLVMALTHSASIRDVILFPLLRPETGERRT